MFRVIFFNLKNSTWRIVLFNKTFTDFYYYIIYLFLFPVRWILWKWNTSAPQILFPSTDHSSETNCNKKIKYNRLWSYFSPIDLIKQLFHGTDDPFPQNPLSIIGHFIFAYFNNVLWVTSLVIFQSLQNLLVTTEWFHLHHINTHPVLKHGVCNCWGMLLSFG